MMIGDVMMVPDSDGNGDSDGACVFLAVSSGAEESYSSSRTHIKKRRQRGDSLHVLSLNSLEKSGWSS